MPVWRRRTAAGLLSAAAALIVGAGLALAGTPVAVNTSRVVDLLTLDWPRWVRNLADLLQIVTPVVAAAAWISTRKDRRQ